MAPRSAVRVIKPIDPVPKTSKQERVYLSGYMGYYEYQGFADLNPDRNPYAFAGFGIVTDSKKSAYLDPFQDFFLILKKL